MKLAWQDGALHPIFGWSLSGQPRSSGTSEAGATRLGDLGAVVSRRDPRMRGTRLDAGRADPHARAFDAARADPPTGASPDAAVAEVQEAIQTPPTRQQLA